MTITRSYGHYEMKLTPHIVLDRSGNVVNAESTAQVSMWDISQRLPLEWSTSLPIDEAHAALRLFEGIGYYKLV